MRSSSNNRGITISDHMLRHHQRLYHSLNLGLRSCDDKGKTWQCADIEIQRLVVRSIDAFLDCVSSEKSQNPLVKNSIADMVKALEGILQLKNEAVLSLASNMALRMVTVLPRSMLQSHILDLVRPLSSLLSSHQLQVAMSCATTLNLILSSLSVKRENEVWDIFNGTHTVVTIVSNVRGFSSRTKPVEYFKEMVSLLSKILWRWPPTRFRVWNDAKLMEVLEGIGLEPDFTCKVELLQLYSALALCGRGALKLLENGALVQMMVQCMDSSSSHSVQLEGFKLAQCFAINEKGCLKMLKVCCEPIIKAIICAMSRGSSHSGKVMKDQSALLMEACRLALITRFAGEHHKYFWKLGIDEVLANLLLYNFQKSHRSHRTLSFQEQIVIAQEGLNAKSLIVLRPFIWDILGWLIAHCDEDLNPKVYGNELCISILMTCACLAFVDSIHSTRLYQSDIADSFRSEPASRSVLMMIYSPNKYIASQGRSILTEILRLHGKKYIQYLLETLNITSSKIKFGVSSDLQIVINLISLACYSSLPQYRKHIIKNQGIKTLVNFIRWCLSNEARLKRSLVAPHLRNTFDEKTCCWDCLQDWEGEDMFLFFSLWGLSVLIHHSDLFTSKIDYDEVQLVTELEDICIDTYAPGPRWYAAYILTSFELYGFPSKMKKRVGKALNEKEYTDLELVLTDGESLSVHGAVLMVRCPSLLPPEESPRNEETIDVCSEQRDIQKTEGLRKKVRLSAHVDRQALSKLLEYLYLGYLQTGVDVLKKLKILARHCNLRDLLQLLCGKHPKWGTPFPSFNLTYALSPAGHRYSDIILEAKGTEMMHWTCSVCSLQSPHMHAHKVILLSSCDYLRALLQSGMQESNSETIKVPVSLEALVKLVNWFYSGEIPNPVSGCLWDNSDSDEKLREVQSYVELCWLAEFWLLNDIHEVCSGAVMSCLDSAEHLAVKIIQIAANFSQWKLAEVAANHMAPSYHHLRYTGELEELDEDLHEMVRAASVRFSRETSQHSI